MYNDKRILCIIPARGGSKGLPGKNIKDLLGKPLLAYSIEHAKKSKYIDRVIVSTDDADIARVAEEYGAELPFVRPGHLATDESSIYDALVHAIAWMENEGKYTSDIIVMLHVTAPLRTADDIDRCIELLVENGAHNVFSVTEAHRNPYFNMVEVSNQKVSLIKKGTFVNRQNAPQVFDMNASIYVWWTAILKEKRGIFLEQTRVYIMPKERSVDIDDYIDFKTAEMYLREGIAKNEAC